MFEVPSSIHSGGFGSYQNIWEVFLAWSKDFGVFDIEEMDVTVVMKSSACYCTDALRRTEPEGEKVELQFRLTIGLRKIDGQRKVVHEHHLHSAQNRVTS